MINTFAQRLQWLIDYKKIKQADVARGVNVGASKITNWLKGTVKKPQRSTIIKLSDFFKCSFDWLNEGKGDPFLLTQIETAENTPELAKKAAKYIDLEDGLPKEVQTWLDHVEKIRPGQKIWFRLEFENRFPEFAEWKNAQKKRAGNDH